MSVGCIGSVTHTGTRHDGTGNLFLKTKCQGRDGYIGPRVLSHLEDSACKNSRRNCLRNRRRHRNASSSGRTVYWRTGTRSVGIRQSLNDTTGRTGRQLNLSYANFIINNSSYCNASRRIGRNSQSLHRKRLP